MSAENPNKVENFIYKNQVLTPEQQYMILTEWNARVENPPAISDFLEKLYPGKGVTGRDLEGRAVKAFLATKNLKTRPAADYVKKERPVLTPEQQEFILNNVSKFDGPNMEAEMAQNVFDNNSLNNLNIETKVVAEFISSINSLVRSKTEVPDGDYKAPNTLDRVVARVNKYVMNGVDRNKMTPKIKKELDALTAYLNTTSFVRQINDYHQLSDREMFEDHFVRYTYNKGDLTQEEVDQFIALSNEKVISANIQKTINNIQREIDNTVAAGDKIPLTLVELSGKVRDEFNQSSNRQQKLLGDLKMKRSQRIQEKDQNAVSIVGLFEMWKEEEGRKKIIKINELNRQALEKDINKLASMEEIMARINGISTSEIMDG